MASFNTGIKKARMSAGRLWPGTRAAIGIRDGRIVAIGRLHESDAERVIDAADCIVAPGFVDLHTHYDAQIFWDPYLTISGWHGITSVVIGNCGFGFAPVNPIDHDRPILTMVRTEAIPLASM